MISLTLPVPVRRLIALVFLEGSQAVLWNNVDDDARLEGVKTTRDVESNSKNHSPLATNQPSAVSHQAATNDASPATIKLANQPVDCRGGYSRLGLSPQPDPSSSRITMVNSHGRALDHGPTTCRLQEIMKVDFLQTTSVPRKDLKVQRNSFETVVDKAGHSYRYIDKPLYEKAGFSLSNMVSEVRAGVRKEIEEFKTIKLMKICVDTQLRRVRKQFRSASSYM